MEMDGDRFSVRVSEGEFSLKMKVYPDDSQYYPHMDTIDFELRKKGKNLSSELKSYCFR